MSDLALIERFADVLCDPTAPARCDERLEMASSGDLKVYYAPFEYMNEDARIVLVGITPGPTQMVNANNAARNALLAGRSLADAQRLAKLTGAFSGKVLRANLVDQLNHWGIPRLLGLSNAADLFDRAGGLLHTTSLLRYPVLKGNDGYAGNPDMTKHPLLRRYLLDYFVEEVSRLPDALFVALGPTVQKVLESLVIEGVLDADRLVLGMLHPSGNCTYRIKYLIENRAGLTPHATNPTSYDEGRHRFQQRLAKV